MVEAKSAPAPVAVIGGGPAGSVAALCLRRLDREVHVFERLRFPRYRIGESLLPGTLSILHRLGVMDRVEAAGFVEKRAATFLWGADRPPWSFAFATPKTAPWVYDHGLQVDRAEFDQILLQVAGDAGAVVHEETEVLGVELPPGESESQVVWKNASGDGRLGASWVVDASGSHGVVARAHGLRRHDEYFRNLALWSYFRGGRRLEGDLRGNILSASFRDGWIWLIPLKGDVLSVGVVTGVESKSRIKSVGTESFYLRCLEQSPQASELLDGAERVGPVRAVREWSYIADSMCVDRAFLCGDAACFIDPLFSQGVHLATYSAMLAAAAIDRSLADPSCQKAVMQWYDATYRAAYDRYHKFICAFYADNGETDSRFWSDRKIRGATDARFRRADWFQAFAGSDSEDGSDAAAELTEGAALLAGLWEHGESDLSAGFDPKKLALRRIQWANRMLRDLKRLAEIRWRGREVRLVESWSVGRESFRLERATWLGDEAGRVATGYAATGEHQNLFAQLREHPLRYDDLAARLQSIDRSRTAMQWIVRLLEEGLLEAFDANGTPYRIPPLLHFGGVGGDDDLS